MWATGIPTPPLPPPTTVRSGNLLSNGNTTESEGGLEVLMRDLSIFLEECTHFDSLMEKVLSTLTEIESASLPLNLNPHDRLPEQALDSDHHPQLAKSIRAAVHTCLLALLDTCSRILDRLRHTAEQDQGIDINELKLLLEMYAGSHPLNQAQRPSTSLEKRISNERHRRSPRLAHVFVNQGEDLPLKEETKIKRNSWTASSPFSRLPNHDMGDNHSPVRTARSSQIGYTPGVSLSNSKIRRKDSRSRQSEQFQASTTSSSQLASLEHARSSSLADSATSAGLSISSSRSSSSHGQGHANSLSLSTSEEMRRVQSAQPTFSASRGETRARHRRPASTPPGHWESELSKYPWDRNEAARSERQRRRHSSHSLNHIDPRSTRNYTITSPSSLNLLQAASQNGWRIPDSSETKVLNMQPHHHSLESLRVYVEEVCHMRKTFLCHLLALKPPSNIEHSRLKPTIEILLVCITDMAKSSRAAVKDIQHAMEEELGRATSLFLLSPNNPGSTLSLLDTRTILDDNLIGVNFPGQYPPNPMIEIDPATPPHKPGAISSSTLKKRSTRRHEAMLGGNFAPRELQEPFERSGQATFTASSERISELLRKIAVRNYSTRKTLDEIMASSSDKSDEQEADQLHLITAAHQGMKEDIDSVLLEWNAGRVALRHLADGQRHSRRRHLARQGHQDEDEEDTNGLQSFTGSSLSRTTPDLALSSNRHNKRGSVSSVMSSDIGTPLFQSLSSPLHYYSRDTKFDEYDVSQLLLDQTNPSLLPPPGLQEQLFEAFVSGSEKEKDENDSSHSEEKKTLSREERIRLVKMKRQQEEQLDTRKQDQPIMNLELVTELKSVFALLK